MVQLKLNLFGFLVLFLSENCLRLKFGFHFSWLLLSFTCLEVAIQRKLRKVIRLLMVMLWFLFYGMKQMIFLKVEKQLQIRFFIGLPEKFLILFIIVSSTVGGEIFFFYVFFYNSVLFHLVKCTAVSDVERKAILTGMNHWENETCIRFREATAKDYFLIRFRTDQPGCWSLVGRQYSRFQKGQDVSIGKGCAQVKEICFFIKLLFCDKNIFQC